MPADNVQSKCLPGSSEDRAPVRNAGGRWIDTNLGSFLFSISLNKSFFIYSILLYESLTAFTNLSEPGVTK